MNCPKCGGKAKVYEGIKENDNIYRRYKCTSCNNVFYTKTEVIETDCDKEEFFIRRRKREREKYRRKCMRMYQGAGA